MNELALAPARQANVSCECVSAVTIAISMVAITVGPTGLLIAVAYMPVRPLPVVSRTASKRPRVVIIAFAGPCPDLAPVVIAVVLARAAATSAIRRLGVPLVISRIVITRIEIHTHPPARTNRPLSPSLRDPWVTIRVTNG